MYKHIEYKLLIGGCDEYNKYNANVHSSCSFYSYYQKINN